MTPQELLTLGRWGLNPGAQCAEGLGLIADSPHFQVIVDSSAIENNSSHVHEVCYVGGSVLSAVHIYIPTHLHPHCNP